MQSIRLSFPFLLQPRGQLPGSFSLVFVVACLLLSGLQKNAFGHVSLTDKAEIAYLPLKSEIPTLRYICLVEDETVRTVRKTEKIHVALKSFVSFEAASIFRIVSKRVPVFEDQNRFIQIPNDKSVFSPVNAQLVWTEAADTTVSAFSVDAESEGIMTTRLKKVRCKKSLYGRQSCSRWGFSSGRRL